MDPDEWERLDDPGEMVRVAHGVSFRRWKLFQAAAVRDARRHHLLPAVIDACSLAERYADGLVDGSRLDAGLQIVRETWRGTEVPYLFDTQPRAVLLTSSLVCRLLDQVDADPARRVRWLREVLGNPFRWQRWDDVWVTRTVHALAAPAYAEGRFDGLPLLADALEDEGCDNPELLAHLRGPGPHARGCWALDVVLGKC